jgi:hypothetical protein
MHLLRFLMRFLSLAQSPPWRESPSIIPAQPSGIVSIDLRDLRDELKLPHVTTECASLGECTI